MTLSTNSTGNNGVRHIIVTKTARRTISNIPSRQNQVKPATLTSKRSRRKQGSDSSHRHMIIQYKELQQRAHVFTSSGNIRNINAAIQTTECRHSGQQQRPAVIHERINMSRVVNLQIEKADRGHVQHGQNRQEELLTGAKKRVTRWERTGTREVDALDKHKAHFNEKSGCVEYKEQIVQRRCRVVEQIFQMKKSQIGIERDVLPQDISPVKRDGCQGRKIATEQEGHLQPSVPKEARPLIFNRSRINVKNQMTNRGSTEVMRQSIAADTVVDIKARPSPLIVQHYGTPISADLGRPKPIQAIQLRVHGERSEIHSEKATNELRQQITNGTR
ncbi:hypothetical protein C8J57DRAFT_1223735 [Mycena rebaudengoi]|nr:hypothetical protein C8J57DRAFT_1223735 [Mycena rebaudengoi]